MDNVINDGEKGGSVLYVKLMLMENVWHLLQIIQAFWQNVTYFPQLSDDRRNEIHKEERRIVQFYLHMCLCHTTVFLFFNPFGPRPAVALSL